MKMLKLNDVLHIRQENELWFANNERSVFVSTKAFGVMQRDLIENIGINRMKTFFFKYGYQLGAEDAQEVAKRDSLSLFEKIEYGPIIHALKGHTKARITEKDIEVDGKDIKSFRLKGVWENSYEAEQHLQNFGISEGPVCNTLTGYATGYIAGLVGVSVFFKELQCQGQGASCCVWEGRLVSEWKEEAEEFFSYSKELPILKELEQTNEKLMLERNNLEFVSKTYNEMTNELIKGNSIDSILNILHEQNHLPIVVEDIRQHVIACKGITIEDFESIRGTISVNPDKKQCHSKVGIFSFEKGISLKTPIYLLGKIVGHCSFLYERVRTPKYEIDSMILDRLASICSLLFLKEKTEVESMEQVKGHFLEEIISGKYTQQEIMRKADFIQLDLSDHYHIVALTYKFLNTCDEKEFTLHKKTYEMVSAYFREEKNLNVLIGQQPDILIFLITEKQVTQQNFEKTIRALVSFLKKRIKNALFLAGISSENSNILEAGVAMEEARSAVRLSSRDEPITLFSDLGMLGILINVQNEQAIKKMIRDHLGVLYENLDKNKLELIDTLYHFLEQGGNLDQTAETLALSKSGLRYRLNKITDLLDRDLRDPQRQFHLMMALKALKIVEHERIKKIQAE
ncbi:sugar diacid utilization regulator/predicted hydrocarbon binding protein [Neobacillus niacini]|uniref:XylR N-terminal domain-containing protein n=1 Tax=Neobacillus niacini TaxID=86668 RepID=UPI0028576994|nr:XylR N-terminal domain-containing protein [Neobacillus niacini]MDR7077317.1 sugar diacid utilization regulator/predicted hydrocarbon binding protein [Neobacillus niacini]